jgi:hypothetical protein
MIDLHIFFKSVVLDSSHRTDLALRLFCRLNCNSSPAKMSEHIFVSISSNFHLRSQYPSHDAKIDTDDPEFCLCMASTQTEEQ